MKKISADAQKCVGGGRDGTIQKFGNVTNLKSKTQ